MKKFFSFMAMVWMMISFATTAAGKTITVVVDDPYHVTVMEVGEYTSTPLQFDENNSATLTFSSSVPVMASSGYEIVSIATPSGKSATTSSLPSSQAELVAALVQDGETVNITTAKKDVKTFTIQTSNPEHIESVVYSYQVMSPVSEGIWEVAITDKYSSVTVNVNPEYKVVSFKDSFGNELSYSNNTLVIASGSYDDDASFYIVTASREEDRTSMLNINFEGDPNDVVLTRKTGGVINLQEGGQTIFFDPETEVPFTLSHTNYSKNIFNVELNGEKLTKNASRNYVFTPTNDGQLNITVEYPDVDVPVHISYASADLAGLINGVRVNGEALDESVWSSLNFTVKAGSSLEFDVDYIHFATPSFTVNGVETQMPLFVEVVDSYDIVASAAVIPNNNISIYCVDWDKVEVMAGDEVIKLTGETTEISVSSNLSNIRFVIPANYVIEGVYDYYTNARYEVNDRYLYNLKNGMYLILELEIYERNNNAIVYVEDAAWDSVIVRYGTGEVFTELTMEPGYTVVKFNEDDMPFQVSGYTYVDGKYLSPTVYLNGTLCENLYGAYSGLDALKDNDVISIFATEVPSYSVYISKAEGVEAEVVKNLVQPVEDNITYALPGTLIEIKGNGIVVKVGGSPISADENGVYNVTINADTDIEIEADINTGVEAVEATEPADVYNMQGVLVRKGATPEEVKALPAGIYVVAGKKVVVK